MELQKSSNFILQWPRRLRVLFPHSSEEVLGMLIKILGFNSIAAQGCCLGKGEVTFVLPLGIRESVAASAS
jgi:hypothetical protein